MSKPVQIIPYRSNERFFSIPKIGKTADDLQIQSKLVDSRKIEKVKTKMMRFVAYIRISSDDQVGNFSIDAQKRAIETWVSGQDGTLVEFYIDEAHSGRTTNRPAFLQMRRDARNRKFDALVVHKFDRFARNRTDALAIKSLLRQEYGVKVFSVTEPSEDSDGAIGALIEGIMESVADWYSRNLAAETVKGKNERARQGFHNNRAPFGMDKDEKGILIPNEAELVGLNLAYELYSTGVHSDNYVAHELNDAGYRSKTGRRFSTDTVRDILQNRTYLGFVKYQPYKRKSDGRRSYDEKIQWFNGKHNAVISKALFDKCQEARFERRPKGSRSWNHKRVYLLSDLVYCAECVQSTSEEAKDTEFGKMRCHSNTKYYYYRCRARDFGRKCSQTSVNALDMEAQVVELLKNLKPPENWHDTIVQAMGQLLGDISLEKRTDEIKAIIERMDFRWDNGFIINQDEYLSKRVELQSELEKLTPIPHDDLERAADMLENFSEHWDATADDRIAQKALLHLMVSRVWIRDSRVVAVSLRANYHIAMGLESEEPTEISIDSSSGVCSVLERERRDLNPRSPP